jgi:hypothetical protein
MAARARSRWPVMPTCGQSKRLPSALLQTHRPLYHGHHALLKKRTGCLPLRRLRKTPMAHPHSRGRRASLITRHSTFCFDVLIPADGARACAGVADAPAAAVPLAPVEEVEESSEDSSNMIERPILGPGSGVGALKQRLKELGQPICRRRASRDRPPSR